MQFFSVNIVFPLSKKPNMIFAPNSGQFFFMFCVEIEIFFLDTTCTMLCDCIEYQRIVVKSFVFFNFP